MISGAVDRRRVLWTTRAWRPRRESNPRRIRRERTAAPDQQSNAAARDEDGNRTRVVPTLRRSSPLPTEQPRREDLSPRARSRRRRAWARAAVGEGGIEPPVPQWQRIYNPPGRPLPLSRVPRRSNEDPAAHGRAARTARRIGPRRHGGTSHLPLWSCQGGPVVLRARIEDEAGRQHSAPPRAMVLGHGRVAGRGRSRQPMRRKHRSPPAASGVQWAPRECSRSSSTT